MTNLKDKTVCVIDSGGYIEVAMELSKYFGKVLYFVEWRDPFPLYNKRVIGTGIDGITRIYSIDDYRDEVDFWYFTDLFYGAMASKLRDEGKIVFGAGRGESLELDRKGFKKLMSELRMPVNEYVEITGITELSEYLKKNPDVYVKLNADMRGHMESSHSENYELFEPVLNLLKHRLGWDAETTLFLVEKPIRPAIEYGYDGSFSGGGYPFKSMFGVEIKDTAYGSVVVDYDKLPEPVKEYNEKLKSILQTYDYRGVIGNEIRHKPKGDAYLIDIYTRHGQPPTSLQIRMIDNFGNFAYETALGRIPNIKYKYKYGVQLIIKSEWARNEPQAVYFPQKFKDFISIKNLAIKDGVYYYIPPIGYEMGEIGACIGMGDTFDKAKKQCIEVANSIKGYKIVINTDALDEAQSEIDKLKTVGIKLF